MRLPVSSLSPAILLLCVVASLSAEIANQAGTPSQHYSTSAPLAQEPSHSLSPAWDAAEGLLKLDVVVTDKSGKPISGLGAADFTVLDNGQAEKILSFQGFDGVAAKPDPPVEIILFIDMLNMPADLALHERGEVEKFLRQNRGQLRQPTSIFGISENGVWTVAHPSGDGDTMAEDLIHNRKIFLHSSRSNLRGESLDSLDFRDPPFISALKALGYIATAERRKPGRKLLIWIGPGCGIGSGAYPRSTIDTAQHTFDMIYWFSALLREARVAIYNISVGESDPRSLLYKEYLNGVKTVRQASVMYLYKNVLAVESGGKVLDTTDDLVKQMDACVRQANNFYTLSFNPAPAAHKDEYHDLVVEVSRPGLATRTNTGYYDQAYYSDEPDPAIRRVTVAQLEQELSAARRQSDAEVANRLSNLELTERMSDEKLASWTAEFRGKKAHQALVAVADASAFLNPPATEILSDASPDENAQLHIISLAADYLNSTMPRLPDYYATRNLARYEETPQYEEGSTRAHAEPLHMVESSMATVHYRNGYEVANSGGKDRERNGDDHYLITYGTFGPLLSAVKDAIAVPGGLTWSRWRKARAQGAELSFGMKSRISDRAMTLGDAVFPMTTEQAVSRSRPGITARSRSILRAEQSFAWRSRQTCRGSCRWIGPRS
jgi:VWFA-related protein